MKPFLFIILTILVQQSIQYENAEEGNLIHPEKPPEELEEDSHNLRKGDIKDLTNIKNYDTRDFQPYNGHYQHYYRDLKDNEIMQLLRELRRSSKIKNFVKDMIAMRGRGRKPRPPQTTKTPKPIKTTEKSKDDSRHSIDAYLKVKIRGNDDDNTEEEQILLKYTPKHKKVDVPMIIFVPSRE